MSAQEETPNYDAKLAEARRCLVGTTESISDKISQSLAEIEATEGVTMPANTREKVIETLKEQHLHSRNDQKALPRCKKCGVLLNDDNWRPHDRNPKFSNYIRYECRNCRNEAQRDYKARRVSPILAQVTKHEQTLEAQKMGLSLTTTKIIELLLRDDINALETALLVLNGQLQYLNSEGSNQE
jgi:hypothetical protein